MVKKILLVDIRLWLYMEYHVNGSLLNVLEKLSRIPERGYRKVFFVYDTGKSKYHKALYNNYKENRTALRQKQTDQEKKRYKEFSETYKNFHEITKHFGRNIRIPNTEADTIIEVMANKYSENFEVHIASSDGDFMCMLDNPRIKQITTRYEVLDSEAVYDKKGVTPQQLFWAKCLCGDTKDNVLGIYNLGEVTSNKTGKVFKRYLGENVTLKDLLYSLEQDVAKGTRSMALPNYTDQGVEGIDSVYKLYEFNKELKRAYTFEDLNKEDQKILVEQVNTRDPVWDEEKFLEDCFRYVGKGVVLQPNTLQFFGKG